MWVRSLSPAWTLGLYNGVDTHKMYTVFTHRIRGQENIVLAPARGQVTGGWTHIAIMTHIHITHVVTPLVSGAHWPSLSPLPHSGSRVEAPLASTFPHEYLCFVPLVMMLAPGLVWGDWPGVHTSSKAQATGRACITSQCHLINVSSSSLLLTLFRSSWPANCYQGRREFWSVKCSTAEIHCTAG